MILAGQNLANIVAGAIANYQDGTFEETLRAFQWNLQESLLKTAQLLRIDPHSIKVHGRAMNELLSEFASHVRQIRTALDGRDFKTLGDLLVHKMGQAVEHWRDAIRSFRGVLLV